MPEHLVGQWQCPRRSVRLRLHVAPDQFGRIKNRFQARALRPGWCCHDIETLELFGLYDPRSREARTRPRKAHRDTPRTRRAISWHPQAR